MTIVINIATWLPDDFRSASDEGTVHSESAPFPPVSRSWSDGCSISDLDSRYPVLTFLNPTGIDYP
jgi:hypothetical protein